MSALNRVCDLRTVYFESLSPDRLALGWSDSISLADFELRANSLSHAFEFIPDWKSRIHIVPGYGGSFQRALAEHLTAHAVPWADWSESSTPGWKWYARLPVKLWWSRLVTKSAIGSFAIGSQAEDDFVRRGLSRSNISYLPYVAPLPECSVQPDSISRIFKGGRRAFLFLGTLSRRKGVDLLLKAASIVLKSNPNWTLILAGNDTTDARYKRLAQTLGLSSQTLFRGAVAPNLIGGVIAAADVLVLPSRYDGWGVVINEAVNGGLAVIGSDKCGASRHLIVPGFNGFRVKAGSQSDLQSALRRYVQTDDLSSKHGDESRRIAKDVDPDLNARRMLLSLSVWMRDWDFSNGRAPKCEYFT